MLLSWVRFVGPRPPSDAPKKVLAQYGVHLLTYFGITCLLFLLAAIFAVLIIRHTRRQYVEEMRGNYDELIEGTLHDHARKE